MKRLLLFSGIGAVVVVAAIAVMVFSVAVHRYAGVPPAEGGRETDFAGPPLVEAGNFRITGPYTFQNLTVFLVHGTEALPGRSFLTLEEALAQQQAAVHETGTVSQLSVENLAEADELYIQSGDIVKGGQQDRTLHRDTIVAAGSGPEPLPSYCVESGRWQQRGQENVRKFSGSFSYLPSKELKLAAHQRKSQHEVWQQVTASQTKLAENVGTPVQAAESASSLQLTLESKAVQEASTPYVANLLRIVDNQPEAIGYVFAINGKLNSAEIYGSKALFDKLWPRLLKASAVEAVSERKSEGEAPAVAASAVLEFLKEAEQGKSLLEQGKRLDWISQESARGLLFETREHGQPSAWLHRTYLAK